MWKLPYFEISTFAKSWIKGTMVLNLNWHLLYSLICTCFVCWKFVISIRNFCNPIWLYIRSSQQSWPVLMKHWSTDNTTLNCLSLGKAKAKGITEKRACKAGTDHKPDFSNDLARRLYKVWKLMQPSKWGRFTYLTPLQKQNAHSQGTGIILHWNVPSNYTTKF